MLRTFLHRARAIIVIRFPGMPSIMNTQQTMEANVNRPAEYPWNNSPVGGVGAALPSWATANEKRQQEGN